MTVRRDGPNGVDVSTEKGQTFNNVQNGDVPVFDVGGEKDFDLNIDGGKSRFHLSCSDQDMNGPEDCGKRQGDGKDGKGGDVNDWILEGIAGDLSFTCP